MCRWIAYAGRTIPLEHYVTDSPSRQNRVEKPNPVNRVWFDDVVVSTEYVGPLAR